MSDFIQGQKTPAEDGNATQEKKLEMPHCPSSLSIKTSLVEDQMTIFWTIDEFGMIPKHEDILKMYDTSFVFGAKKNIPCQWCIGLGLTQAPVDNPNLTEEWLSLCYRMVSAPPGASTVD